MHPYQITARRFALEIVTASAVAVLLATPAMALQAKTTDDVPVEIRNANSVSTYYYDVTPDRLVELVLQDIQDGRQKFSKSRPSLLDPHIRYALAQGKLIDAETGESKLQGRSVASGTGAMCVTQITQTIPISGIPTFNPQPLVTRSCSLTPPPGEAANFWANWARSTLNTSVGLGRLFTAYNLSTESNSSSATPSAGLRGVNFRPRNTGPIIETHGTVYFNTYGGTATSTEIIFKSVQWQ